MVETELSGLPEVKYEVPGESDSYSSKTFSEAYEGIDNARQADVSTTEGLESLANSLGNSNLGKYALAKVDAVREEFVSRGLADLAQHARVNAEDLVKKVGDERLESVCLNYAPTQKTGDEHYDDASKKISKSRQTLEQMRKDPNAYYQSLIAEIPKEKRGLYEGGSERLKQKVLQAQQAEATENVRPALIKYGGAKRFVTQTSTQLGKVEAKLKTETEKYETAVKEDTDAKYAETGVALTAEQEAEILERHKEQGEKVAQLQEDAKTMWGMFGALRDLAAGVLKSEQEQKDKKEK